jgi:two-component system chemotaxis response regulator CheB
VIKVLIVDDSPMVRRGCERILSRDPEVRVVGSAPDPFAARDLLVRERPDVLTLDVEMPKMDGITFLRKVMHYKPVPTVILSSITPRASAKALEAMRAGAVAVICKPGESWSLEQMGEELLETVKAAAGLKLAPRPETGRTAQRLRRLARTSGAVVAIGASTGGTVALENILEVMPENGPAMVMVQHMPPVFTKSFADRLNTLSAMRVREAQDGDLVLSGQALLAPGGKHLLVRRSGMGLSVQVKDGPNVSGHKPSVDVLFGSVAQAAGPRSVGLLLTGMGADGAKGLLAMKNAGAQTFAQDEESSVVFGMPKAAIDLGAADKVVSLERAAGAILAAATRD